MKLNPNYVSELKSIHEEYLIDLKSIVGCSRKPFFNQSEYNTYIGKFSKAAGAYHRNKKKLKSMYKNNIYIK